MDSQNLRLAAAEKRAVEFTDRWKEIADEIDTYIEPGLSAAC